MDALGKEQVRIVVETFPQNEFDFFFFSKEMKSIVRAEGLTVKVIYRPRTDPLGRIPEMMLLATIFRSYCLISSSSERIVLESFVLACMTKRVSRSSSLSHGEH